MTRNRINNEYYNTGIKSQKFIGWIFIIFGGCLTITIIGAIIGLPILIVGIGFVNSKEVNGITGTIIKNKFRK